MKYQLFNENEWIYPDSIISEISGSISLESARNSSISFQFISDLQLYSETPISIKWNGTEVKGLTLLPYQLMPVKVEENSGTKLFTTLDYDSVKDFVTRQAPFYVYDVARDIDNGMLNAGRLALYFRINVASNTKPGEYESILSIICNGCESKINIKIKVYKAIIPNLENSQFNMINWLDLKSVSKHHDLIYDSEEFWDMVGHYLDNQIDMRNNYIMIPSGVPVYDENKQIIDFDFSEAVKLGNMALKAGFKYICGGFIARFKNWEEKEHYLLWDRDVSSISFEAYRQLKIYFGKLWAIVKENNWNDSYMQCLVDEPQLPNSEHYRILSGICRKFMPGVKINDPVESTDLEGAVDIWVVKQAVYEKYKSKFEKLQALCEEIWIYTCGYPAGYVMNRVLDLPLIVSRLPMWMCYKYKAKGFLHWGYNVYNDDVFESTCYYRGDPQKLLPPGNSFVVYPGTGKPWYSVRGHLQRAGSEDFELLYQLGQYDRYKAEDIISKICTTFEEYNPSAEDFKSAKHELLEALEEYLKL